MSEAFDGHRIAEERIAEAARTGQDWLDLGGLGLTHLPAGLFRLTGLRRLNLGHWDRLTDGAWTRGYAPNERHNRVAADLPRLAALPDLTELSIEGTDCAVLDGLSALTGLVRLGIGSTQVSDLGTLRGLAALQYLDCSGTKVSDLGPLRSLTALQHLNCGFTEVSDLGPLRDLATLQHLDCGRTEVSDLGPLRGLTALQLLICAETDVSDLGPLRGLRALRHLDCGITEVSDLDPLRGLAELEHLDCGGCHLNDVPRDIWMKPSLRSLYLSDARIPDIPDEVLGDYCLNRLRAHLKDLEAGAERMRDVKLLILGNGGSGKTQIARRLSGLNFDPTWDSTHGIKVSKATLPAQDGQTETTLHLWDFGGQDIYHGTHALFVRSRSLFLVVWCATTEQPESQPDKHGMVLRNHPLPYWLDYVRHLGDGNSPVVVAQAQVDRTGVQQAPDPDGLIAALGATPIATSTADPHRLHALLGALQDAVAQQDRQRGAVSVGKGRVAVQRKIEGLRRQDGSLSARHRTITRVTFNAWCQEAGGVSSPAHLLAYLHGVGTLFYQEGLFQDRIVLDHAWALDAIYAVFDRAGPYTRLTAKGGRFDRADLATVWRKHSDAEQRLFLGMMRSCGICFVYRGRRYRPEDDDDTIYLAPDLLPDRAAIQARIDATWGDGDASHRQTFTYPFLHHGLIRGVIAQLGELGGDAADYFQIGRAHV